MTNPSDDLLATSEGVDEGSAASTDEGQRSTEELTGVTNPLKRAMGDAPSADAESDAKDLFARGRELRNKGDCANASPLFYKAWRIFPSGLGNLRNYAECEEQLGQDRDVGAGEQQVGVAAQVSIQRRGVLDGVRAPQGRDRSGDGRGPDRLELVTARPLHGLAGRDLEAVAAQTTTENTRHWANADYLGPNSELDHAAALQQMTTELQGKTRRLQQASKRLLVAQQEERQLMARDLHDGVLQSLNRQISSTLTLSVLRSDEGFAINYIENPLETEMVGRRATITSSVLSTEVIRP